MLQKELPPATPAYWLEEVQVHIDAVAAWISLGDGRGSEALELARAAADREDAVDKHPVTPGEVLPARELYADMLIEVGAAKESLSQYQLVLRGSPNRLNALLGAAKAAAILGDSDLAEQYRATVREQTRSGNPLRKGLAGP